MGTVARLLDEHVSFRCTSVDRIGVRGYIPGLQYEGGLIKFLLNRAGGTIPSPVLLTRNHERLVNELEALEESTGVPVVRFKAGQSKEEIARPYQDEASAAGRPGLVLVGKAQERTSSWRGFVDDTHAAHRPGHPHMTWRRQSSVPDHWYFYFFDPNGDPPSSNCAPTRPTHCGVVPTATSGPSVSWPRRASASRPSTTGCVRCKTLRRRTGSAPDSVPVTCAASWRA